MWWHWLVTAMLGGVALAWVATIVDMAIGMLSVPDLANIEPLAGADLPRVSIVFSARDEAEKLPAALASFLAVDYPNLEVVAVNDRSEDATRGILDAAAARDSRLTVVHIKDLPAGWLGKTHGLQTAFERSTGEWIIFTDADVKFAPDLLRRVLALALRGRIDHLPLLGFSEVRSIGEKILMTFFGMSFAMGTKPWRAGKPGSRFYFGVGAFQMVRRSAYVAMGEHKRLAMEVVDDVKLGKLMQNAGFCSRPAMCGKSVSVYWHSGVAATIRGTEKNFFATCEYSLARAVGSVVGLFVGIEFPWIALVMIGYGWPHGWLRVAAIAFAAVAIAIPLLMQIAVAVSFEISPLYALTQPLGGILVGWMILRSTYVTLKNGGVSWRGTFYPLEELRRGMV
jgi:glycosyltransferase involved in cell wall biosynthesis